LFFFLLAALIFFSCESSSAARGSPAQQPDGGDIRQISSGIAEEIRDLIETGRLSSMIQALEVIRSRNIGSADYGRMMNGIITALVRNVYPDSIIILPPLDMPQTYNYTRLIREAENGNYISPDEDSSDFFEYVLPFLAINDRTRAEVLASALRDTFRAGELRPDSVLPPYFRALIYEYTGRYEESQAAYRQAYQISGEFYPALTGIARIMSSTGRKEEAAAIYSELVLRYPDSIGIRRQLAVIYYEDNNWDMAEQAVDGILQNEPRNGEFLLMKAHILIERGNFSQAVTPLDTYASISAANANNRLYLFLRARQQYEGSRSRDSALNYLRSIIRANPDDEEALLYAAKLLFESQRPADQAEGREYLAQLRGLSGSSIEVLSLSLRDAVQRESWQEAQGFLNRILAERRTVQDLVDAYYVEHGLGNNSRALSFARELYEGEPSNVDYVVIYVSALIDNNRNSEASALLESRLASSSVGAVRSSYFYLRSRIRGDDEAALVDLRSSLFEDPRNLDALIAMFEIYHRRREERRAVYYLRQALAISPDNPRLKRYETEYAALLGRD
jgi:tetratricopeptide (TPR) repeat protein